VVPGDVVHDNDWSIDNEQPVREEGEDDGEVIEESINVPSLPDIAPGEKISEKPSLFEEKRPSNGHIVVLDSVTNRPSDTPQRRPVVVNKPGQVLDVTRIPPKVINRTIPPRSTPRPFNRRPEGPEGPPPIPDILTPPKSQSVGKPIPPHSQNPRFPIDEANLQDPKNPQYNLPSDVMPPPPPPPVSQTPSTSMRPPPRDNIFSGSGPAAVIPSEETVTERRPTRPTSSRPTTSSRPKPSRRPPVSSRPISSDVLEPPRPKPTPQVVEPSISEPETSIIITTTEGQDYSNYDNEQVIITASTRPSYGSISPNTRRRTSTRTVTKIRPTRVSYSTRVPDFVQTKYVTDEPRYTSAIPSNPKLVGAGFGNRPLITVDSNKYQTINYRDTTQRYIKPQTTATFEPTTRYVTQTETLTITATETTVLSSRGQPYTKTVVLTQTEAPRTVVSTIIGTITEIHTIDPSTITTTISATASTHHVEVTTTVYQPPYDPSSYPSFTIRPLGDHPPIVTEEAEDTELHFEGENEINNKVVENSPPIVKVDNEPAVCQPQCDVNRNEFCKEYDGAMRCVCRPGFARTFYDRPCTRKFTIFFT
jgi:hypothetical protein